MAQSTLNARRRLVRLRAFLLNVEALDVRLAPAAESGRQARRGFWGLALSPEVAI